MTDLEFSPHSPAYPPADLSTCDREPIHVPGAVQPHGVLLAVEEPTGRVVMASANAGSLLGVADPAGSGRTLADLLGAEVAARVLEHADAVRGEPLTLRIPFVEADVLGTGTLRGRWTEVVVHRSGKRVVVELEEVAPGAGSLRYASARSAMARLVEATTVAALADRLAQEIRTVTGFDRVMVYRFDQDWNGEVIAEDRREDLNPFLGLHYPATDIPAQARRLYTVNWIRLIADVAYTPVPLEPVLDPGSGEPLDLSFSTLRSVSPIHLEYLANMGVTASMSVSLIVDGQLWGLVACHHYAGPHRPSHDARAAAEFLGQIASQMMAEQERSDQREAIYEGQLLLAELNAALVASGDRLLEELVRQPATREMLDAGGLALFYNGRLTSAGRVPPPEAMHRIAELLRRPDGDAAAHHHLSALDPALAEHATTAAGALVVGSAADRWFAWYRPEMPHVVDWGGDPANAKLYEREGDAVRLSPRKSFDQWREVVRGQSSTWTAAQHDLANAVRAHTAGLLLHRSREQIAVAESLQRTVVGERVDRVAGLEVATQYVPASEYQLGGDWWDCVELADGRHAFVVGDVAGHGVEAVAAMTQIRTALRAYLFAGVAPGRSLDLLDAMIAELMGDQVASVLLFVLDPATGAFELVNAGHPAPLLFGPDPDGGPHHVSQVLAGTSRPLLGIGVGVATALTGTLPVATTLVVYTDGLHERRGRDLAVTLEELRAAVEPGPPPGASGLDRWTAALVGVVPGARDDDTTVLAVRRPGV